jgi:hypothetical protein
VKLTRTRRTYVLALAVGALVTAANASQGAYFSQSWGWVALAFLVPTSILLIIDGASAPGRLRASFAVLMVALGVWNVLSATWSISSAASIREAERMLVYVALALAVALVLRRGDGPGVLAGLLVGIVCISSYALGTRLFPDRLHTVPDPAAYNRLAEPLGYWNALGLLAVMGVLLSAGFAAHARRAMLAASAGAVVPLLVLTTYFTFSRGAWAALLVGATATAVLDPRRVRYVSSGLLLVVPSALCVAYASQQDALTIVRATGTDTLDARHRVALVLVIAAMASAILAWSAHRVAARVTIPRTVLRAIGIAAVAFVVLSAVIGVAAAGGPAAGFSKLRNHFGATSAFTSAVESGRTSVDLNQRLFSVSGSGRAEQLRVAWNAGRDHPLVGNGSGSFEYLWYEHRPDQLVVRDSHSLYMETFAELGIVGVALLGAALLVLVAGSIRARRMRFAGTAFGAFVAWSAAAAIDWHWEMVSVTLTALLAGAVGLVFSEQGAQARLPSPARAVLIAACVFLSVCAVWSLVGNQALFAGREALLRKNWTEARDHARRARTLLFWSAEPALVLGDAAAGLGDRQGALREYRNAVATDPHSWVAWLRLAQVARGAERADAYRRVRQLNPRQEGLPGE